MVELSSTIIGSAGLVPSMLVQLAGSVSNQEIDVFVTRLRTKSLSLHVKEQCGALFRTAD